VGGIAIVILSQLRADTASSIAPLSVVRFPEFRVAYRHLLSTTFLGSSHQYYIGTLHNVSLETESLCIGLPTPLLLVHNYHADIAYSGVFDARCPLAQT